MKNIAFLSAFFKLGKCDESICGSNAVCHEVDGKTICACREGMTGDPFIECRECLFNLDWFEFMYTDLYQHITLTITKYFLSLFDQTSRFNRM